MYYNAFGGKYEKAQKKRIHLPRPPVDGSRLRARFPARGNDAPRSDLLLHRRPDRVHGRVFTPEPRRRGSGIGLRHLEGER